MTQAQSIASAMIPDQKKQILRLITNTIAGIAQSGVVEATLDKDGAQLVIERRAKLKIDIEREMLNILKQLSSYYPILVETALFKPVSQLIVPARTKLFDAAEFYQTGAGLIVHPTFAEHFDLSIKQPVLALPKEIPYVASYLKGSAYDTDIRSELPETHLSTLADIAALIEAQTGGKSGFLLSRGWPTRPNIFYVEGKKGIVFAVSVRWVYGSRGSSDKNFPGWAIFSSELDWNGRREADDQVLCPGNAAL